jgi:hypothetical protein
MLWRAMRGYRALLNLLYSTDNIRRASRGGGRWVMVRRLRNCEWHSYLHFVSDAFALAAAERRWAGAGAPAQGMAVY